MTKAQLIEALAGLGVEASAKSTVPQLQAQLDEAKAAKAAPPADPPADNTPQEGAAGADSPPDAGDDQPGGGDPPAQPPSEPPPADPPAPSSTVLVKVGPNGKAGRIIVGGVAIDGRIPGRISRADFARLRVTYDLREVED